MDTFYSCEVLSRFLFGYCVFISNRKLFHVNSASPISNPAFEPFHVDTFSYVIETYELFIL